MNEILSEGVARIMISALVAQGATVHPVRSDGRFAAFDVVMPTGQAFSIRVEEVF